MKHHLPRLLATATVLSLSASAAFARPAIPMSHPAPGHRLQFDPHKFMRVSEIRPGMKGYALTVFRGTKIEKFDIEILGVVAKFNEGKDYILFRALNGPSVTQGLNIAHGMSGSPIYVNNKLVGAISMGIPGTQFPKYPIALATPIEDMFDSWSPDLPAKLPSVGASAPPEEAPNNGGTGKAANFQPIAMPVMVSGMNGRGISRLRSALSPYHFDVMAGGGAGSDANDPRTNPLARGAKLVPGSAVGVSLVQGDMDLTATGTVTYRDGNRVLLFGHPFTSLGPIDAAMTTAYVVSIFPSYQDSIKLGSPIKTVGRIFQDRPFSVGGLIGSMPAMIPMTVSVNDQSIKRRKDFHVRILNHPLLTSQFVTEIADQAIAQVHGQPGDSEANVTLDADVEEIGHVRRTNIFYDAISIDQSAIGDLDSLMRLLQSNPFYPLAVKNIKMTVTIQNRHDTAEIDHIFLKQSKFAPGDTVNIGVVLKPYKRDLVTRNIAVKIPESVQDGPLSLNVQGGGSSGGGSISLGGLILMRAPDTGSDTAGSIAQLVKKFVEKPRNDDLVARLTLPTTAISIDGEKLSGLPPTLAQIMQSTRSTGLKTERDEVKVTQAQPYIVSGSQSLTITVQRKPVAEPAGAGGSSGSTPTASGTDSSSSSSSSSTSPALSVGGISGDDDAARLADYPVGEEPILLDNGKDRPLTPNSGGTGQKASATISINPSLTDKGGEPKRDGIGSPATLPAVKTVGRLPSIWHQSAATDFAAGTLNNVSVTSQGDVRLSASLSKLGETTENYVWSLLPDGQGNVYVGTGDHGIVYKMDAAGKMTPFFKTGELEVTALAQDGQGNIYAGTAPNGFLYKVGVDGKGSKIWTAQEKYITALHVVGSRLYIATGGGTGRVYSLDEGHVIIDGVLPANIPAQTVFTSPETNILSLASDKSGNVYAGSAPNGIVYKITPDGKTQALYNAAEANIASLAVDSQGNVYAGTSPKGNVYKIAPDGTAKLLPLKAASSILSLRLGDNDTLYACAGNTIYRISPDETVQSFTAPTDEQFLTLGVNKGDVYAGTATVGSVYKLGSPGTGGLRGVFQSAVHDAGLPSRWGSISWIGRTPPDSQIALQTRSGNVERPDASWSAWSSTYINPMGQPILSPPGRFLQYQAVFTSPTPGDAPRLEDVSLYYLPRNRPPSVQVTKPAAGEAVAKTVTIQWTASDPDKDTLAYDLSYSRDGGQTWTPIKKKAPATATTIVAPATPAKPAPTAKPAAPQTPAPPSDAEVAQKLAEMRAALDAHPEIPAAVRDRLMAQAPVMARRAITFEHAQVAGGNETPAAIDAAVKDTTLAWDTAALPDGLYQVQVVASDKPSNPGDALTDKDISAPFLVANKAPTLLAGLPVVNTDKIVTLRGTAASGAAFVRAVQGRLDTGDYVAALADDGLFDSSTEAWTLTLSDVPSGAHTIEVQTVDRAGNMTSTKVPVRVP